MRPPLLLALALLALPAAEPDIVFPGFVAKIDVKTQGAVGDGVSDDTAALNKALEGTGLIYLPAGTYLVSDTLRPPERKGSAPARRVIQGAGEGRTIIKLKDACPGFTEAKGKGKPVLLTSWGVAQAFRNGVRDLTIDVGAGNPGAVGCGFMASNQGGMHRVTLKAGPGSGLVGLELDVGDNGPLLVSRLTILGFATGIHSHYGQCFNLEHITLRDIRGPGLRSDISTIFVQGFDYQGGGPAVVDAPQGFTVLYDVKAQGQGPAALQLKGRAFVGRVDSQGYERPIAGLSATAARIEEWRSHPTLAAFPEHRDRSLALPIKDTPRLAWDPPEKWVDAGSFRQAAGSATGPEASPGKTWREAVQAAIDSGASTVYLPPGADLQGEIILRGNVSRLTGLERAPVKVDKGRPGPTFVVADGSAPLVVIERADTIYARWNVRHEGRRTLVLSSLILDQIEKTAGSGDLYIEDVCVADLTLKGGHCWSRQHNSEYGKRGAQVEVEGGSVLWMLGLKNEGDSVKLRVGAGSQAEFWAYVLANSATPSAEKPPVIVVEDGGRMTGGFCENVGRKQPYQVLLRETRGGVTKELTRDQAPRRGSNGSAVGFLSAAAP